MRVEVLDSLDAFDAVKPEWDALLARHAAGNVFLTHTWLRCAWLFVAFRQRLRVLLLRHGARARLVGGVALSLATIDVRGLPVRQLAFLTDPVTGCVRSDIMLADDAVDVDDCVSAIAGWLADCRRHWDICVLDSIPADAPCLAGLLRLSATARHRFGLSMAAPQRHWMLQRLAIRGDWQSYQAAHGAHLRAHLAREQRKLRSLGAVGLRFAVDPAAVRAGVETFIAMERHSLKRQRDNYTPFDENLRRFYRTALAALAVEDKALVASLTVDQRPAAVILATRHAGDIHTLNDMYHPDYRKANAGHYLRGALIEWAWRQSSRMLDFNGYGEHLQRWRTEGLPLYRTVLYSPSCRGRLLRYCRESWLPWARGNLPAWMAPAKPATRPGDRGLAHAAP